MRSTAIQQATNNIAQGFASGRHLGTCVLVVGVRDSYIVVTTLRPLHIYIYCSVLFIYEKVLFYCIFLFTVANIFLGIVVTTLRPLNIYSYFYVSFIHKKYCYYYIFCS